MVKRKADAVAEPASEDKKTTSRKSPRLARIANTPGSKAPAKGFANSDDSMNIVKVKSKIASEDTSSSPHLHLIEETGDLFAAPNFTVLIHACNCEGTWGKGIAAVFKKRYPAAFEQYHEHCVNAKGTDLRGTALLIPPIEESVRGPQHFIGCLFTSHSKGRKKDSVTKILENTGPAMEDLIRQCSKHNETSDVKVARMSMCKINSGLFKVLWEKTRSVLEDIELEDQILSSTIDVVSKEEE